MAENKKKLAQKILARLKKAYPKAKIVLNYSNNIQLLVAVILSAQCTDKKVNEVTEKLFANRARFEQEIKSTGFYRAKAKNIINTCKIISEKYGGKLPKNMAEMIQLPGVARKTANIVLGNAYGVVEGIAVDTHVRQFANYCGLSNHHDPVKIERDLMELFPKKDWFKLTYMIINYNREMKNKANRKKAEIRLKDICPGAPV